METEIETKFLDTDPAEIRERLRANGAELTHPERLMRRRQFDFPDIRLDKAGAWLRLRDEGDRVTLSFKQWHDHSITGTTEASVEVSDFENTASILTTIGLIEKSYQDTKRESWRLDGAEVVIDWWPWIPPLVEIEASTERAVKETAAKLGFDMGQALYGGVVGAYQRYYDVSREEIDNCREITFGPVPEWLEAKRRR